MFASNAPFKNTGKIAFVFFLSVLLAACVGAGTVTGSPYSWDEKDQAKFGLCPIAYNKMVVKCPLKPVRNTTSVEEITPETLVGIWGVPKRDTTANGIREMSYNQNLAWRGLVVFVIIPIPLLIPLGHNEAIFSFQGDRLVHVEYKENSLDAAICGLHSEAAGFGCVADWH